MNRILPNRILRTILTSKVENQESNIAEKEKKKEIKNQYWKRKKKKRNEIVTQCFLNMPILIDLDLETPLTT